MTHKACPYEEPVAEAARSGKWSSELEAHRNGCLSCAELTLVVAACTTDAEMLEALDAPLPDPSAIWLRARLATRERDYHRATQAIVWVQRAAIAVVLAVGMAGCGGWREAPWQASIWGRPWPICHVRRARHCWS